jgi:hypothetical protein
MTGAEATSIENSFPNGKFCMNGKARLILVLSVVTSLT